MDEFYKYAKEGVVLVMPLKERKKFKAEPLIIKQIISSPDEVKDRSVLLDNNKHLFLKWDRATDEERDIWRKFFDELVADKTIGKMLLAKTGLIVHEYTSRDILVVMPEKERKAYKAELSVTRSIVSHPDDVEDKRIFRDSSKYVFLKWDSATDKERDLWNNFFKDLLSYREASV